MKYKYFDRAIDDLQSIFKQNFDQLLKESV